jgi:heat shock protein HslJ
MCPQPAGLMEQEQQFLKALQTVATARFEGDRLELRTADGAMAATLAKASGR